ncbi:MAG: GntR family transcriptional regulator, partial [candidate division NC10 bacterium]|nr:GntR family transcriptional regulator [candidate division NC10 bacterium]
MGKAENGGGREGRGGRQSASTFPNRSIPLYYRLENILRSKIEGGEVLPNHKLPTEQELSREYKISRATVRQALAALVSEGLLYRKQGKGTFVTEKAAQTKSVKLT